MCLIAGLVCGNLLVGMVLLVYGAHGWYIGISLTAGAMVAIPTNWFTAECKQFMVIIVAKSW